MTGDSPAQGGGAQLSEDTERKKKRERPGSATSAHGQKRKVLFCPHPDCNRSFRSALWRLKVHYRAQPLARGSGVERGHGTELTVCPVCGADVSTASIKDLCDCFFNPDFKQSVDAQPVEAPATAPGSSKAPQVAKQGPELPPGGDREAAGNHPLLKEPATGASSGADHMNVQRGAYRSVPASLLHPADDLPSLIQNHPPRPPLNPR
mmetsp:Transcript_8338/g.23906  ORF Transcript_8338/g.23906 Transcript_8338/m.23906 type:complete len:207 (+) Transcript_8338:227-847(+)